MPGGGLSRAAAVALILAALAAPRAAEAAPATVGVGALCRLIAAAAAGQGLPEAFLARLIWKESRFDVRALSPAGAQGVAQFMPATARRRGLVDPFDPVAAIPAAAHYLAELRRAFGNLGLAAAAYNGGENRVTRWLAGAGGLPGETLEYVRDITGRPAAWFREAGREVEDRPLAEGKSFQEGCDALPAMTTRAAPRPPWGVVLAGGRSRRAAGIALERARRALPPGAAAVDTFVARRRRAGAGPLYAAGLSFESRGEARALCLSLRRSGVACTVRRP